MKYRYMIERNPSTAHAPFHCGTIDGVGDSAGGTVGDFDSVTEAQAAAEASHDAEDAIRWREPPAAWQPDAILVSQFFDDGVEPNNDR